LNQALQKCPFFALHMVPDFLEHFVTFKVFLLIEQGDTFEKARAVHD
jgi:hypothetical protein